MIDLRIIILRFFEFLIPNSILSLMILGLYKINVIPMHFELYGLCFTFALIIYLAIQFFMLRDCFVGIGKKGDYIKYNLCAYLFFIIVCSLACGYSKYIYTGGFGITKFLHYFKPFLISNWTSSAVFHMIMILLIIFAPVSVKGKEKPEIDITETEFNQNSLFWKDEKEWDGVSDYRSDET